MNPPIPATIDADDVMKAFEAAPIVSAAEIEELAAANRKLDEDPIFLADLQKALVVSQLRQAFDETGETQASFAKRWGKTRQYVSNLLSDKLTNFTIETITYAASLMGLRTTVKIHRADQEVVVKTRSNRAAARIVTVSTRPLDTSLFQTAAPMIALDAFSHGKQAIDSSSDADAYQHPLAA